MKQSDITWGSSLDTQLSRLIEQDFVPRRGNRPIFLPEFVSADLPDPAAWRTAILYVTDKGCVGVSNGAAWVRADGSAL